MKLLVNTVKKVTVDVSIADAKPENYDALLIPGGFR